MKPGDLSLAGKHAWVCGASRGIGRAIALNLAQSGARLTLLARDGEALNQVLTTLPGDGHRALIVDFSDAENLTKALAKALVPPERVEILIHNSGGPPPGPALQADPSTFELAFRQHLVAGQVLVQALVPHMRAAAYGRIINIISTSVRQPIPGLGVSNTVRGAVASWAKTLAHELAPDGITVNNVLPGYTQTDRLEAIIKGRAERSGQSPEQVRQAMLADVPMGRFASADEIAAAVAFLASPAAAYITGVSLPVDGGRIQAL
ncbi:MAG: short-chain dehydrogenase [Candidatus Melainabacteria bacterium HGW-Melainabacteria-1]|nr:MAG: short-chain dehydrogenase [Candidatus Melainabacteria bacterium HGW-Melainabacteria-1]